MKGKVLVACEFSGTVRDAFAIAGWDAWSCDLLPTESRSEQHIQGDVVPLLDNGWDMMIAHPPCTYLCSSGLHRNKGNAERQIKTQEALTFVRILLDAIIPRLALENPIGCISSQIRKPDQIIQPHQFGHNASKSTCLWLKQLPKLTPTEHIAPRIVNGLKRWDNQTDSGQNSLPPSENRWALRSITYQGIADAMAMQWG